MRPSKSFQEYTNVWSAAAERSDDAALACRDTTGRVELLLDRHYGRGGPRPYLAKAVSRYACHRTPYVSLGSDEIHVWQMPLDLPAARVQHLRHHLSPQELVRAARFRFPTDRDRYIAAHGILRVILARYLDVSPDDLCFRYGPCGKPVLERSGGIEFNPSHAEGLGLCAVARGRRLGIDVERFPHGHFDEGVAEQFFSRSEVAALRALPVEQRPRAFLNCWTRKEAFVKARGEGLSVPLDRFDVSLASDTVLLRTPDDPAEAGRWSLCALPVGPDYVAALAVENYNYRDRLRNPDLVST